MTTTALSEKAQELLKRLRDECTPEQCEHYLKFWDCWRQDIIGGDRSDGPRMGFESVMDAKNELITATADLIQAQSAELIRLSGEVERLRAEVANVQAVSSKRHDERQAAEAKLSEIKEISRRVNSSGGYTLEERLDRIAAIAAQGERE